MYKLTAKSILIREIESFRFSIFFIIFVLVQGKETNE